jgi:NADH:ubiquinone oxidoreductase subunit F (NADH-binding)/NAD-dependent dihydropyrimidine dehydrogenase PreA subunit/(2Fe-2S) ferredoxin
MSPIQEREKRAVLDKEVTVVSICMGPAGLASGAREVMAAFEEEVGRRNLNASIGGRGKVTKTGCRGPCGRDVLVDITGPKLGKLTYQKVSAEMVPRIVEEHISQESPIKEWLVSSDYYEFRDRQQKVVLKHCGEIDPEDIDDYLAVGGYRALTKALREMTPEEVIEAVTKSGLRGRGGAGFPTGLKWKSCRGVSSDERFIVCNADEGDPGAFMDRAVLEGDPHRVLEGMVIGGFAIGATSGYIYVRAEYPLAVRRFRMAVEQASERGYLGKNILGSGYDLEIHIKEGAGAFVCGESTALMFSIEGKRGMPRTRPPQSVEAGLWNRPTTLNNVETFANVPDIVLNGADWYSSIGTEKSKGTKIFALAGRVKSTGLIEVPMGVTIRNIIFDIGGGIPKRRKFKGVQIGGPSGGCLPEALIDSAIDYESLLGAGAMMGSGSLVVMDETTCMVEMARFFLDFTVNESCGKCVPCRVGTRVMLDILERITQGEGQEGDIELLEDLSRDIKSLSLCGLGESAPNPVLSTIRYFRDEYEAHIRDKSCPTAVCVALTRFEVIPDLCRKCGVCVKACPVDAVSGGLKQLARIEKEKCIKCRACIEACPFLAIK